MAVFVSKSRLRVAALLFAIAALLQGCGSPMTSFHTKVPSRTSQTNSKTCNCVKHITDGKTTVTKEFHCQGSSSYCESARAACDCPVPSPSIPAPSPIQVNTNQNSGTGVITLPPKCLKTQQKDCVSDANPKCFWGFVKDDDVTANLKGKGYTRGWEVSCFPRMCLGLLNDMCKLHSGSCQWDWVEDDPQKDKASADAVKLTGLKGWQLSCIPRTTCEGLQSAACDLHPKKCHWDWTGNWKDSCKTGAKPSIPSGGEVTPAPTTPSPTFNLPPPCLNNPRQDCGLDTKNPTCQYMFVDDSKLPEKLKAKGTTKGWEVSCIPQTCLGLSHDVCDLHPESCQWDWVEDKPEKNQGSADAVKKMGVKGWQLSCIPKDSCEGLQHSVCSLHPKKCHYQQTDSWKTSCKAGPAPTSLSEEYADDTATWTRRLRASVGAQMLIQTDTD